MNMYLKCVNTNDEKQKLYETALVVGNIYKAEIKILCQGSDNGIVEMFCGKRRHTIRWTDVDSLFAVNRYFDGCAQFENCDILNEFF